MNLRKWIFWLSAALGILVASPARAQQNACGAWQAVPSADDATASITAAMLNASRNPNRTTNTPSGAPQGTVYLPAGTYAINPIPMLSNVRFEIEPGATIRGRPNAGAKKSGSWQTPALFMFGSATGSVSNITMTAGDGCGGPGKPSDAKGNKPSDTNFRGTDPAGSAPATQSPNRQIPFSKDWPIEKMWVLDLDPDATKIDVDCRGMSFVWAYDVVISQVFSIQNPRQSNGAAVPGVTSNKAVMSFNSLTGATDDPVRENAKLPHRINVSWHYNILSPGGYGPNQVRSCFDCTFTNIFSHGGTAMRVESGAEDSADAPCAPTGTFAKVDKLVAERITGINGNRAVALVPHCQSNGVVKVRYVMGVSEFEVVNVTVGQVGGTGSFATGTQVFGIQGAGGNWAQQHVARGYLVRPSSVAIKHPAGSLTNVTVGGTMCWPAVGKPGGLADGDVVASKVRHGACPAWP